MNRTIILSLAILLMASCTPEKISNSTSSVLKAPSDIVVSQKDEHRLDVSWKDTNSSEKGYEIYLIFTNDVDHPVLKGSVEADVTNYLIEDEKIQPSKKYYVGVKAKATDEKYDSKMAKVLFETAAPPDPNAPKVSAFTAKGHNSCVVAEFEIINYKQVSEAGVCWSVDGEPNIKSDHQMSVIDADGKSMLVISNAILDYGKEYSFRPYLKYEKEYIYGESVKSSLGKELEAITLDWKNETVLGLPSSVKLYSYDGTLNGRNCKAWYAIADLSGGDVEFKVSIPDKATTIDDQYNQAGNCLVMVNGGYFYSGKNTGLAYVNGSASGSVTSVRGSLKSEDSEYNEMYVITRGIFGVDADGKASVYWTATSPDNTHFFYNRPLPTVKGEAKYGIVSASVPSTSVSWAPKYAQSAGPLLLINGKCPFDFESTPKGADYYYTNYEIIPYDIWGEDVIPDRTAAGYTADGKIVLFIVDGRIDSSRGANLVELAQIMKGLGCVGAVNFDGGGSTGMMAGGKHLNDLTGGNRPVVSTLGFYKK